MPCLANKNRPQESYIDSFPLGCAIFRNCYLSLLRKGDRPTEIYLANRLKSAELADFICNYVQFCANSYCILTRVILGDRVLCCAFPHAHPQVPTFPPWVSHLRLILQLLLLLFAFLLVSIHHQTVILINFNSYLHILLAHHVNYAHIVHVREEQVWEGTNHIYSDTTEQTEVMSHS